MPKELSLADKQPIIELLKGSDKAFEVVTHHYAGQFNYHAAQRLTTFRYFVTAFSIFGAGYATMLAKDVKSLALPAAGVAFVAYSLVLCFARLDKRNEQIIQINEEPIRQIQRSIDQHLDGEGFFATFDRSDDESRFLMTFGSILPVVFLVTAVASLAGVFFALSLPDNNVAQLSTCVWVALMLFTIAAIYLPFEYRGRKADAGFSPRVRVSQRVHKMPAGAPSSSSDVEPP